MEIASYLTIVRRRWISVAVCAVVLTVLALGLTLLQTKEYASDLRLFVTTSKVDDSALLQGGQFSQTRVQSYADLVGSRDLATAVIERLGLDTTADDLIEQVTATVAPSTVNLTLTVVDPDPARAQQIAQAYGESVVALVRRLETPPNRATAPIKAEIVDSASLPETPVSPNPVRNTAIGLVLGLLLGVGVAVLRQTLDTRVRSSEDVLEITGKPVLGAIGYDASARSAPLISALPPYSPRAESFRMLRTNLRFVDVDSTTQVFVITSAIPEEGKTSTSANLALSLAQAGVRTLLVEGDLRRPQAADRLGKDGAVGVTSVLLGRVRLDDAIQSDVTGPDFLASGPIPPNPAELLQSRAMGALLTSLRERYDVVLIDAPPLLPVTDAAVLSAQSDGAILVVRHGKASRDQVRLSHDRLAQVDARLVGTVLNMVPSTGDIGYGYSYAPEPSHARR